MEGKRIYQESQEGRTVVPLGVTSSYPFTWAEGRSVELGAFLLGGRAPVVCINPFGGVRT